MAHFYGGVMSLTKSKGNMYPWVTHTHSHLGGECPHKCVYCYVDNPRFGRPAKYQGELRLIDAEFAVNYGSGKTIFIENCNDLFAEGVPNEYIRRVLSHCRTWPWNTYVFQTKNPGRMRMTTWEPNGIFGTTIETNRNIPGISKAPRPQDRVAAMIGWKVRKFVTIEPVLDFDVDVFAEWIARIEPEFVNLGADSKAHHLPEPTIEKIMALVDRLKTYGIELREKHNLSRFKP